MYRYLKAASHVRPMILAAGLAASAVFLPGVVAAEPSTVGSGGGTEGANVLRVDTRSSF